MFRLTRLALLIVICLASLSCRTYTTGLDESLAEADETAVIAALRAIAQAEMTYAISTGGDFGSLEQLKEGGYLDSRFMAADGGVKDYVLTVKTQPPVEGVPASFSCNADPKGSGPQAGRHFYIDSTSPSIHVNRTQSATAADPVHQP